MITGTFKQLDAWDSVAGPFIPGSGSELKGDDYDWPPYGVSQVAWAGLQVALDSLQATRWHLDGAKTSSPRHFLLRPPCFVPSGVDWCESDGLGTRSRQA